MSFGGSPSDIVNIAKLCYKIYNFCHTAPAELQGLSNRLDKMGRKLNRIMAILDKSGIGPCEQAVALQQHLFDTRAHLEPLLSATNGATSAKGLTRLALNQGKLRRIEKDLDVDQQIIDEIKIDLIIECSLRNLRDNDHLQLCHLDPRPQSKLTNETLRIDEILPVPDVTSTVSLSSEAVQARIMSTSTTVLNASKALMMARRLRARPSFKAEAITINDVAQEGVLRNFQMTNDFISEIVSLAEETELYFKDADRIQNLEHLPKFTEKATRFQLALQSSSTNSRAGTAQYQLPTPDAMSPDLSGQEFFGHLSSTSDEKSMRMCDFDHISSSQLGFSHTSAIEDLTTPRSHSDRTTSNELPLQDHSGHNDNISRMSISSLADAVIGSDNEPSTKDQVNLCGRSKVSLALDTKASLTCSFNLEVSEGSVLLKVIPTEGSHGISDAVIAFAAPHPLSNSLSRMSQSTSHATLTMSPRSFHHCFQSRNRPIPHFLHPDVEGPIEEPDAPYTITFTERQYISVEGASEGPRWTTSLMYIFHEKQDHITLCEMIFGKNLLMCAGSDKIDYAGREIAHMSAVALWFDDASGILSMTFCPNLTDKRATLKDMELKVHGLWDPIKASPNPNTLAVIAEPMPRHDESLDISAKPDRQSSVQSGGTFLSKASSTTTQRGKKSGKLKYTIKFTRSSDRASFLNHLRNSNPTRAKP